MATLLKRGSHGAAVRDLQSMLNALFPAVINLVIDQNFGPATERAVKVAQSKLRLVVDGKAGVQTMAALRALAAPTKPGRAEPDKSAIEQVAPQSSWSAPIAGSPPNAASSKKLHL